MAGKLIVLCLVLVARAQRLQHKTVLRINQLKGVCKGYENAPVVFKDVHLGLSNKINIVNSKIVVKRDILEDFKMQLILTRCTSKGALDSCEKYQTLTMNHMCNMINGANRPWSPFMNSVEPRIKCPILKGEYVVRNGTFDGSMLARFPLSGWYWLSQLKILPQNGGQDVILCMLIEGQIVNIP